jgi:hypothetical protein
MRQWFDCGAPQSNRHAGDLRQRVRHEEFELAGLVAAGEQAEHVVALDPDVRALAARTALRQRAAEVGQEFEGSDERRVAPAGNA